MSQNKCVHFATILRKQLVAITGLGLTLFVLTHMAGNLLILISAQKYNEYGHALISNPLLEVAEIGLVAAFFGHIALALALQILNRRARPSGYAVNAAGAKATSLPSKSMAPQGLIILVFLITHLITFKYGAHYEVNYGHGSIRDLHRLVVEVFQQPGYVAWYVIALLVLGLHLSHGVKSMFQTVGAHHPRYEKCLKGFGYLYAFVVAAGFLSQPLYVFLIHKS